MTSSPARLFSRSYDSNLSSGARYRIASVLILSVFFLLVWTVWSSRWSGEPFSFASSLWGGPPTALAPHSLPPLYREFVEAEHALPQHNWSQIATNPGEKLLFVARYATRGQGWGNSLQELLLHGWLAYKAGRTFVFHNYTWTDNPDVTFAKWHGKKIPAQIPYSVSLRGPLVGDVFPLGEHPSPAVSRLYFEHVCQSKTTLYPSDVYGDDGIPFSTSQIIDKWVQQLNKLDDPCVQTTPGADVFTHKTVYGVPGAFDDAWQDFSTSPIITHFGWSPLIEMAFDTNRDLFLPSHVLGTEPLLSAVPFTNNTDRYTMIPGLMVLHLRRGDYESHCVKLARRLEHFVSVNAFSSMMDQFTVPRDVNAEHYRKHCFPSIDEVTAKVEEVLKTQAARGVRKLFIMTNADSEWIARVEQALLPLTNWETVSSSRDLTISWEQKYVAQCIDSLVAQRAQVFIGNGFSTLTSTAVTMRLANGFPSDSTRFW
ncbi:hypothetical protein C8Q79DRAFT_906518 [Trametes meyenii]|nr:hypothetical protein C8Q79DRAFT_906518 [Trametes meyenii]